MNKQNKSKPKNSSKDKLCINSQIHQETDYFVEVQASELTGLQEAYPK